MSLFTWTSRTRAPEIMSCNDANPNPPIVSEDLEGKLPGEDFVQEGLADLAQGRITELALLVLVAGPRLRRLGIDVPEKSSRSLMNMNSTIDWRSAWAMQRIPTITV